MREQFFRQEVSDERSNKVFGDVMLQAAWSLRLLVYILLAIFATALTFLFLGTYHRKEVAKGLLIPTSGLVKVYAPRQGLIGSLKVTEGSSVREGSPLFELGHTQIAATGNNITALKRKDAEALHSTFLARLEDLPKRQAEEQRLLQLEADGLAETLVSYKSQIIITRKRLDLKKGRLIRLEGLAKDKAISQDEVDQERDKTLMLENQLKIDQQGFLQETMRLQSLKSKIQNLDAGWLEQRSTLLEEISQIKQQILDLELHESQVIQAPVSGKVTSLQAYPGMNVEAGKPVLVILPLGGELEAHLFVPTRAIGFLKKDQAVLLQYDAFPYQKFGVFRGSIKEVSGSSLHPNENPDSDFMNSNEPMYRVIVKLDRQSIHAYGKELFLQSGMLLKADIVLEERSLTEWLLEPLYRVGG